MLGAVETDPARAARRRKESQCLVLADSADGEFGDAGQTDRHGKVGPRGGPGRRETNPFEAAHDVDARNLDPCVATHFCPK